MGTQFRHVHITRQGDKIIVYGPINTDRREFGSLSQALHYAQNRAKAFRRVCEAYSAKQREKAEMDELWASWDRANA